MKRTELLINPTTSNEMDGIPPGITYLSRAVPYFTLPSIATFISLSFLQSRLPFRISNSAISVITALARPIIFLLSRYYSRWANRRAAEANGAIVAPYVQDSPITVIRKVFESLENGYPAEVMLRWGQEYGQVVNIDLVTSTTLWTNEPEHLKAILATQFESFVKGPLFMSQLNSLFGQGVFSSDGEMWKFHRAMTRPFFTRERIGDFEIYDRNWETSFNLARDRLAEGFSIDIQDLIARFTLDSGTEFLFGRNVGSLDAGIPYHSSMPAANSTAFSNHPSTSFVEALTEGSIQSTKRLGLGEEWPLMEFMKDKVLPLRKIMDDFTDPLLKAALDKRDENLRMGQEPSEKNELTLLSHLVNHTQDHKILKDEAMLAILVNQLINLLIAGRDTTMGLLAFSVYMIAEHPDMEKRLREEIYEKVGPINGPKYEHMREMKYMRAFINEVLRLYPPVPINARRAAQAVVLPAAGPGQKPIYVPKDTNCLYTVINMHRRTDLWGPDALTFDPDRFLDVRVQKYLVPNPYIFCPFNAGPRICLGQQFAYHEASYFLVRLLQHFTGFKLDSKTNLQPPPAWKMDEGSGLKQTEKIVPTSHLTMYIKGGLWIYMKEVKQDET